MTFHRLVLLTGFANFALCGGVLFGSCGGSAVPDSDRQTISLAGEWGFKLDPQDEGLEGRWFTTTLSDPIRLPGSLQEQGYGKVPDRETRWLATSGVKRNRFPDYFTHEMYERYREAKTFRFPYWLQPKRHYVGAAWYQKSIDIPDSWKDKQVTLNLERCHWGTTVWIGDKQVFRRSTHDALGTAHRYDLTPDLKPGRQVLTLRVDNRMLINVGLNAHSISDQTQSAWNGVVGDISLQARPRVYIQEIQVFPNLAKNSARVEVVIANPRQLKALDAELILSLESPGTDGFAKPFAKKSYSGTELETIVVAECRMGSSPFLWDEFNPRLYGIKAELRSSAGQSQLATHFGMREVRTKGSQIYVNGKPVFLRGTLESCIFPLTGYPPTDLDSWLKVMRQVKNFGLNHVRFHSWCPPEAAFLAADREGVYLQPEASLWASINGKHKADWAGEEARKILSSYGNHPSFLMMSIGNEMHVKKGILDRMLREWKQDSRHIYTGGCNRSPDISDEYDFIVNRGRGKNARVRYQSGWPPRPKNSLFTSMAPQTTLDWRRGVESARLPILSHEIVQRCSYPDPLWQNKYSGSFIAGYLDIAKDQLRARGMTEQVPSFVELSGRWQVQQFKEEIEAALRTRKMAGFQLLDIHDFPGQGAALVGVLDAFWDEKGYVTGEQFRQFCSPTVPLARMQKRVWLSNETFQASIEIAHFGPERLKGVTPHCLILDSNGHQVFSQALATCDIEIGNGIGLGSLSLGLDGLKAPAKYRLVTRVGEHENSWDFWVYPAKLQAVPAKDIVIVTELSDARYEELEAGAKVLWVPAHSRIRGNIPQCFSSIYWNGPYTNGGESNTLGMVLDPSHPVFRSFPTDKTTNWQWWELLVTARPMILDEWGSKVSWPKSYKPLIQPIDDWNVNRKLALLAEVAVGDGKLMICSMDISGNLNKRFVARQLRSSLLNYMNSSNFNPKTQLRKKTLLGIVD